MRRTTLVRRLVSHVFALCVLSARPSLAWLNDYDQPVHFQCPDNQFLAHISSVHNNHAEDRVWDYKCSPLPLTDSATAGNCAWTNYVNPFDQPVTYQCPGEGFITGMASVHDNHAEDRQFKFQCCDVPGTVVHSCFFTDWANDWDGPLDFIVPNNKILRGIESVHDNRAEDRRFKFEVCDFDYFAQD